MRFDLTVNQFTIEAFTEGVLSIFGEQFWRPYAHVDDIGRAIVTVLAQPRGHQGRTFNVGDSGENYTKRMMYDLLKERLPELRVEWTAIDEDPRSYKVSFERIREELGFEVTKRVPDGMDEILSRARLGVYPDPMRRSLSQLTVSTNRSATGVLPDRCTPDSTLSGRPEPAMLTLSLSHGRHDAVTTTNGDSTVKGTKRNRRYIAATIAALGAAAVVAGSASAAPVATTIPIPRADSQPEGITLGADGALWFADFGSQAIGRTTAGPGSAQSVPNDGPLPGGPLVDISGPADITVGPDNNIWFSAFNGTVGKVTGGLITGFTVSASPTANLRGITSAGGSPWVLEARPRPCTRSTPANGAPSAPISLAGSRRARGDHRRPRGRRGLLHHQERDDRQAGHRRRRYHHDRRRCRGQRHHGRARQQHLGHERRRRRLGPGQQAQRGRDPGAPSELRPPRQRSAARHHHRTRRRALGRGVRDNSVARVTTTGEVTQVPLTGCTHRPTSPWAPTRRSG